VKPRIGIIGGGNIGTAHGKAVHFLIKQGIIDAEFVALAENDDQRRFSFANASGVAWSTADADELIASPEVNTVYVCTPTVSHRSLVEKVCARKKALFCEKPLAFNAEDAAVMSATAKAAGVTHQVGLVMRFSAVTDVTRALINDPELGRPMTASMVDDQYFPIQGRYASSWRGDVTQVGAGTLLEHAIHDVDMLISFFGPVRRVHGATRNFSGKEGVEDLSTAMIEFESGAVATHVSIWHNILHRGSSRRINVTLENAQFSWDDDDWAGAIRMDAQRDGGRTEISSAKVVRRHIEIQGVDDERLRAIMTPSPHGQAYVLQTYRFLQAVSEDRPAWPDFDVAVYAHRVVDAIYQSAREGRPIDIT
jgi:predicted dehydrogenase